MNIWLLLFAFLVLCIFALQVYNSYLKNNSFISERELMIEEIREIKFELQSMLDRCENRRKIIRKMNELDEAFDRFKRSHEYRGESLDEIK